jgi:hypothetical protein
MIEPPQEQANRRLLDGLLAQTLLASLPRQDTAGPENLQHLAQEIESCASDQLRPRLRLVEEKIIPAQLVGGPAKMGLVDFACPSRRAPVSKRRSLLTLNNRAHGAEIDFFEDYDSQDAKGNSARGGNLGWSDLGELGSIRRFA